MKATVLKGIVVMTSIFLLAGCSKGSQPSEKAVKAEPSAQTAKTKQKLMQMYCLIFCIMVRNRLN